MFYSEMILKIYKKNNFVFKDVEHLEVNHFQSCSLEKTQLKYHLYLIFKMLSWVILMEC